MWIFRKYKKKLEKRFKKGEINRAQLNVACDVGIIARLKLLATFLDTPLYPLAEHVLELGMSEVAVSLSDASLTEIMQRHLLKEHLLVGQLNPLDRHVSDRAKRIDSAMNFLRLVEAQAGSVEAIKEIIARILKEA